MISLTTNIATNFLGYIKRKAKEDSMVLHKHFKIRFTTDYHRYDIRRIYFKTWEEGEWLNKIAAEYYQQNPSAENYQE